MEKIKTGMPDIAAENVERLLELFPEAATEVEGPDGEPERAVDYDVLRGLLGDSVVQTTLDKYPERYQFTWPGKAKAGDEARRPVAKTLRPVKERSKDWDTTQNLYIEGDNLDALKILRETYAGKVKLIYIDPPYNTGHDFVYRDSWAQEAKDYAKKSGGVDEDGGRLETNYDTDGRFHSKWCSMIYPRLKLARDLLTDDGAIFISIDDGEAANLKKMCDEIFGYDNFLTQFIWRKVDSPNDNHVAVTPDHEYIIAYCKDTNNAKLNQREAPELIEAYKGPDEQGRYWRDRLLRKNGKNSLRSDRPTMFYPLEAPDGTTVYPIREDGREGCWAMSPSSVEELAERGDLIWKKMPRGWTPYTREYAADNPTKPWMTIWNDLPAMRQTKSALKDLFEIPNVFDTPKPPELIERIMDVVGLNDGDILVDFFSGSASSAHAVMERNLNRKLKVQFILVQIPEKCSEDSEAASAGYATICDVGEERIRRAGEKIKREVEEQNAQLELGQKPMAVPDIGFRVLRVDSTNFRNVKVVPDEISQASLFESVDNVKDGRTDLDLLFEVLPTLRIFYSDRIREEEIGGKRCYVVDEPTMDEEAGKDDELIACFDEDVDTETIEAIAKRKPDYAVMRDAALADDAAQSNFESLFRTFSPNTVRCVI